MQRPLLKHDGLQTPGRAGHPAAPPRQPKEATFTSDLHTPALYQVSASPRGGAAWKEAGLQLWGPLKPQWAPTHPLLPSVSSLQVQSPELWSPATEGGARHTCPWRPQGGSVLGSKLGLLTAAWHTREAWLAASPSQPTSGRSASALTSHRARQLPQHLTPLAWFPRDPKRTLTTSVREVTHCVSNPHRKNRQVCYPQVDR